MNRTGVGIIGLGMAANKHALALADLSGRAEVVAAWSPTKGRRDAFAAAHAMPVCDTLDKIIDNPAIGLVLILTPPFTHLDLVRRCAQAGKHVLLEKPIEGTLERSEAVVRVCREAGIKLGIVFQNRWRTPHVALRDLLRAGTLGEPISVNMATRWWRPDSYFQEPGRGIKDRDGGGVMLTQGIHMMDQLVDLIGCPRRVTGFAATSSLRKIDTEDAVSAALQWRGGAIGVLDATTTRFPTSGEKIDIAAEHGSAALERKRLRVWLKDGRTIDVAEDEADPAVQRDYLAHRRLIEDMLDAMAENRPPGAEGAACLAVHRLIDAILLSSISGKVETVQ